MVSIISSAIPAHREIKNLYTHLPSPSAYLCPLNTLYRLINRVCSRRFEGGLPCASFCSCSGDFYCSMLCRLIRFLVAFDSNMSHSKFNSYVGLIRWSSSISSRIRLTIDCPDWSHGLANDLIAGWLSVKVQHLVV